MLSYGLRGLSTYAIFMGIENTPIFKNKLFHYVDSSLLHDMTSKTHSESAEVHVYLSQEAGK